MLKKDDKVGNKNGNEKGKGREKEESEKKIEIDSQKKSKFWLKIGWRRGLRSAQRLLIGSEAPSCGDEVSGNCTLIIRFNPQI